MTFHAVPRVFHNISKFLSDFRIIISVYHMVEHIETYFPFHNLTSFKVERYQKVSEGKRTNIHGLSFLRCSEVEVGCAEGYGGNAVVTACTSHQGRLHDSASLHVLACADHAHFCLKAVSCIFAFSLFSLTFHIWIRGFASCPTFPRNDLKNSLSSLGYLRCLRYLKS